MPSTRPTLAIVFARLQAPGWRILCRTENNALKPQSTSVQLTPAASYLVNTTARFTKRLAEHTMVRLFPGAMPYLRCPTDKLGHYLIGGHSDAPRQRRSDLCHPRSQRASAQGSSMTDVITRHALPRPAMPRSSYPPHLYLLYSTIGSAIHIVSIAPPPISLTVGS